MSRFESELEKTGVGVPGWCHECPSFKELIVTAHWYGVKPEDVAIFALLHCQERPKEQPTHNPDGTEREYWETQQPTCELGVMKQKEDAYRNAERLTGVSRDQIRHVIE